MYPATLFLTTTLHDIANFTLPRAAKLVDYVSTVNTSWEYADVSTIAVALLFLVLLLLWILCKPKHKAVKEVYEGQPLPTPATLVMPPLADALLWDMLEALCVQHFLADPATFANMLENVMNNQQVHQRVLTTLCKQEHAYINQLYQWRDNAVMANLPNEELLPFDRIVYKFKSILMGYARCLDSAVNNQQSVSSDSRY